MSRKRTAKSIFVDFGKGCNSGQVVAREVSMSYILLCGIQKYQMGKSDVVLLIN
jgi:hypothetical protein